jgi:hypothetical protein
LTKAQQRMKDHADKKRRELQFKSAMKFWWSYNPIDNIQQLSAE